MRSVVRAAAVCLVVSCRTADRAPDVPVRFEGNAAFSETRLREVIAHDLRRYDKGAGLPSLDDASYRIAHHYRLNGYPDVAVDFETRSEGPVFLIDEGPEVVFGRLGFQGNEAFPDRELRKALPQGLLGGKPPYSRQLLELFQEEIRAAYLAAGFVDVQLAEPNVEHDADDGNMDVTLRIAEGRRYVLSSISGVRRPRLHEDLSEFVGGPYSPSIAREIEARAAAFLTETGHPFPKVGAVPRIDREGARVDLHLEIRPGPEARLGEARISGLDRVRKSFVEERADLPSGEDYRRSALRRAEERLEVTQLFRAVRVAAGEVQEESGEVPVVIMLEERPPGEFSVRAGYGTLEGPLLGTEVGYLNVLGGGETVRLSGSVSSLRNRADLEASVPYFLGTEWRPAVDFYGEDVRHPSFEATSYGLLGSLTYPAGDRWSVTGGARYAILRTEDVEEGVPPGDVLDYDYLALFLASNFDRRDNALLPTRGYIVGVRAEWAGEAAGSDIDFVNVNGRASFFVPLGEAWVGALSVQGGRIAPIGSTDVIPIALRYFAGGISTVRGFEPESLGPQVGGEATGGEVFAALQAEVRVPVVGDLHGALFADRGGVWAEAKDLALDDLRYSVGTGLRFHTPAGAIVADVAWNPRPEEDEEPVEFHFSIGFPF